MTNFMLIELVGAVDVWMLSK